MVLLLERCGAWPGAAGLGGRGCGRCCWPAAVHRLHVVCVLHDVGRRGCYGLRPCSQGQRTGGESMGAFRGGGDGGRALGSREGGLGRERPRVCITQRSTPSQQPPRHPGPRRRHPLVSTAAGADCMLCIGPPVHPPYFALSIPHLAPSHPQVRLELCPFGALLLRACRGSAGVSRAAEGWAAGWLVGGGWTGPGVRCFLGGGGGACFGSRSKPLTLHIAHLWAAGPFAPQCTHIDDLHVCMSLRGNCMHDSPTPTPLHQRALSPLSPTWSGRAVCRSSGMRTCCSRRDRPLPWCAWWLHTGRRQQQGDKPTDANALGTNHATTAFALGAATRRAAHPPPDGSFSGCRPWYSYTPSSKASSACRSWAVASASTSSMPCRRACRLNVRAAGCRQRRRATTYVAAAPWPSAHPD